MGTAKNLAKLIATNKSHTQKALIIFLHTHNKQSSSAAKTCAFSFHKERGGKKQKKRPMKPECKTYKK